MRVLHITPHLSTGGLPRYLLSRVKKQVGNGDEVWVVEWSDIAPRYRVQKDKLGELLGDRLVSWPQGTEDSIKANELYRLLDKVQPDVVHFAEFPEGFIPTDVVSQIYGSRYMIYETTHDSAFEPSRKVTKPSRFEFVSEYHQELFSDYAFLYRIDSVVVPYEAGTEIMWTKEKAALALELDLDCKHVLNVGLFTPGKNQGECIEIARSMLNEKVVFHFVGNQAGNFEDYWGPLLQDLPSNCVIWGEQEDVGKFYSSMDLLLFTSKSELMPLVPIEALAYDMPVLMYKDEKYTERFDGQVEWLLDTEFEKKNQVRACLDLDSVTEAITCTYSFLRQPKVTLSGDSDNVYTIDFIDCSNQELVYRSEIKTHHWAAAKRVWHTDWLVRVQDGDELVSEHSFELGGKRVLIGLGSKSLGDTIAWVPYAEEFAHKHSCEVVVSTFWNNLFAEQYPEITFVKPGDKVEDIYALYEIGCFDDDDGNRNRNDWRVVPMQQIATDILGLDFVELKPRIVIPDLERTQKRDYVCIAEHSTLKCKYWNRLNGWQEVVEEIRKMDLDVMVVSKEKTNLKHVRRCTNKPIEETIRNLNHAKAFIGVGSGLSWLAWAMNKPVVMISGFSEPFCEFKESDKISRVINKSVCHGCFNDVEYSFDRGDWNWCPRSGDFECTKSIEPKQVMEGLRKVLG